MKARNFKRWVAGLCATAMLAGAPAMVGYATDIELTRENTTGETTVKATVVENDNQPTYTIMIPDTVEFGQIQLPTTAADAYVTTSITVKCTNVSNLGSEQAISVLVKDSKVGGPNSQFLLNNSTGGELAYEMLNEAGQSILNTTWYSDGFLYAAFTSAGQSKPMTLRLNKAQLYGKDLATWGGEYTGTLNFTTKIGSITDVQSMEEGIPVM